MSKYSKFHPSSFILHPFAWAVCLSLLLGGVLLLAACGDQPVDRVAEINKAIDYSGAPRFPTVDPTIKARDALGFNVVILGIRDYYPNRPGEVVDVRLENVRDTSLFLSQLCSERLQHFIPDKNDWEDIAYGRPCPGTDTNAYRLYPGTYVKIPFEFDNTRALKGKSWMVPGTYRLMFTYYLRCPDAYNTIGACEDQHTAGSNEFQIKIDPGITPSPGS
jgi:hypothetical protein